MYRLNQRSAYTLKPPQLKTLICQQMTSSVTYQCLEERMGFHMKYVCHCLRKVPWSFLYSYSYAPAALAFIARSSMARLGSERVKLPPPSHIYIVSQMTHLLEVFQHNSVCIY